MTPTPTTKEETKDPQLGYDKDNPEAYKKYLRGKEVLQQARENKKGFRKPSKKDINKAENDVKEYREGRAKAFINDYKEKCAYYGVELDLDGFDMVAPRLYQPRLGLKDFNPTPAKSKAWSEALEENLATRINCEHTLNDEGTVCEKCGLNPENWGEGDTGANADYVTKQRERIQKEKEQEQECKKGNHVLNKEAEKDPENAPMAFCVKCRKPYKEWENKE